jgi:hypothetical protein
MQPTKWDLILGQRPVPLVDHLLEEVSRLFAKDLGAWPPGIDAFDAATGAKVAQLLENSPGRPDVKLYAEAFRLTRLDLSREMDAYDDYLRNQRWLEAGLEVKDKAMLLFISRFIAEQLLGLGESTQGRVNRAKLLEVLEKTRRAFFAAPLAGR